MQGHDGAGEHHRHVLCGDGEGDQSAAQHHNITTSLCTAVAPVPGGGVHHPPDGSPGHQHGEAAHQPVHPHQLQGGVLRPASGDTGVVLSGAGVVQKLVKSFLNGQYITDIKCICL